MFSSRFLRVACAAFAAACFLPAMNVCADDRPPQPRTAANAVTPNNRNPKRHEEFLAHKTADIGLLFLGDSITDFWPGQGADTWAKFAPYKPADFAVSGERTEDVLWRITNGELDGLHPRVVVLLLGTNNIGQHSDEQPAWAAAGMRKVVETIHQKLPFAKLLLLGIFPRGEKDSSERKRNDIVNAELAMLDNGTTTRYLDIGHVFVDGNGAVLTDLLPDKLHPNAKGYQAWYDAMLPTLSQMLK